MASTAAACASNTSSLHYLDTGDPQVSLLLQKVRVQGDILSLILGETGRVKNCWPRPSTTTPESGHATRLWRSTAGIHPRKPDRVRTVRVRRGVSPAQSAKGRWARSRWANGGTLFLDEIGDMPLAMQARLLHLASGSSHRWLQPQHHGECIVIMPPTATCVSGWQKVCSAKTCTTASMVRHPHSCSARAHGSGHHHPACAVVRLRHGVEVPPVGQGRVRCSTPTPAWQRAPAGQRCTACAGRVRPGD